MHWLRLFLRGCFAGVALLSLDTVAHAEHEFAPESAAHTIDAVGLRCSLSFTCPIDYAAFQALVKAVSTATATRSIGLPRSSISAGA